jgi:gliding motility-associated-like protein
MVKHFAILILCFCSCLCIAQNTFQKELTLSLKKPLLRLAEDGNVYVASAAQNPNDVNIKLLKINSNTGAIIWQQYYDGKFNSPQLKDFLIQKDGIVMGISDESTSKNSYLLKTDFQGKIIYHRKIGKDNITELFDIEEDNVNNIWISALQYPLTTKDTGVYFTTQMRPDGSMNIAKQTRYRYNQFFATDNYQKTSQLTWNPNTNEMWSIMDATAPYCKEGDFISWSGSLSQLHNAAFMRYQAPDAIEWVLQRVFMEQYILTSKGDFAVSSVVTVTGVTDSFPSIGYYDIKKSYFKKVVKTDYLLKLLDKHPNGILVYDEKKNTILKLDEDLNTTWKKQIDKCLETSNFEAIVLPDGSIFTIRNMKQKTIIAKLSANGEISNCPIITLKNENFEQKTSFDLVGSQNHPLLYDLPILQKTSTISTTNLNGLTKDFCLKADAAFTLPDSVCLGFSYTPMIADTSSLLKHIWQTPNKGFDDPTPSFYFDKKGTFSIKHDVQVGICRDTISRKIKVFPTPKLNVKDTVVCGKASLDLDLFHPNALYYFNNEKTSTSKINITQSGIYKLKIKNNVCADSATIKVKVIDFPSPFAIPKAPICVGQLYPIVLQNFNPIAWDGKPFLQDTFFISDASNHFYKATYSKDSDCKIEGKIAIARKKCQDEEKENIYVPNTFSPNEDGFNDFFKPEGKITLLYLAIFDRWGNQLFESESPSAAWDGTYRSHQAEQAIYTWTIRYLDLKTGEEMVKSGDVMLLK